MLWATLTISIAIETSPTRMSKAITDDLMSTIDVDFVTIVIRCMVILYIELSFLDADAIYFFRDDMSLYLRSMFIL